MKIGTKILSAVIARTHRVGSDGVVTSRENSVDVLASRRAAKKPGSVNPGAALALKPDISYEGWTYYSLPKPAVVPPTFSGGLLAVSSEKAVRFFDEAPADISLSEAVGLRFLTPGARTYCEADVSIGVQIQSPEPQSEIFFPGIVKKDGQIDFFSYDAAIGVRGGRMGGRINNPNARGEKPFINQLRTAGFIDLPSSESMSILRYNGPRTALLNTLVVLNASGTQLERLYMPRKKIFGQCTDAAWTTEPSAFELDISTKNQYQTVQYVAPDIGDSLRSSWKASSNVRKTFSLSVRIPWLSR